MTTLSRRRRQKGNSLIEFTMVGIPLMFVIISTFEMSRAMWTYETLAYAVKEGTRYAAVHGENCAVSPNNCAVKVSDIAGVVQAAGIGLDPGLLQVTLTGSRDRRRKTVAQ